MSHQLKAAAKFMWGLKADERKYEVKEVAAIYGVDPNELHRTLLGLIVIDLKSRIARKGKAVST